MRIILLPFLLWYTFVATAQNAANAPDKLPAYTVHLNQVLGVPLKKAPAPVYLLDARQDSSKIGFIATTKNAHYKIVSDRPLTQFFDECSRSNKFSSADSGYSYLLVLRKLWLTETTLADEERVKIKTPGAEANQRFGKVYARIEVYAQKDAFFYPLFRLDSCFFEQKSLRTNITRLLPQPFVYCLRKLDPGQLEAIVPKRKKMTFSEVTLFSNKNLTQPVLLSTGVQRGVYHTYADFLRQKTDTTSFTIQSAQLSDEVVVSRNGKQEVLDHFWGFSDGKQVFIRVGLSLFTLHPVQNTFEFWGFRSLKQKYFQAAPVGGDGSAFALSFLLHTLNTKKVTANQQPLQLDMETGIPF
jgi:hypothetical protein